MDKGRAECVTEYLEPLVNAIEKRIKSVCDETTTHLDIETLKLATMKKTKDTEQEKLVHK